MHLNHPQGAAAEEAAWQYLRELGCRLVARNWHCPFGEIDLIVTHEHYLVFVEVRYRKNKAFGGAAASITAAKLGKIQRSAAYYQQTQHHLHQPCRIDAVLLDGTEPPQWLQNITG